MILRLFVGSAPADARAEVAAHLAGRYLAVGRDLELSSYAAGLRVDGPALRFVVASTWERVEQLRAVIGDALDRPVEPLLPGMMTETVDHFELVSDPVPVQTPTADAVLRVARMVVSAGREEEFYAVVRHGVSEGSRTGDLLSYHLGRRVDGPHLAVAVSVWRSRSALGGVLEEQMEQPAWTAQVAPLLDTFTVDHFDVVTVVAR